MDKAKERALAAYPVDIVGYQTKIEVGAVPEPMDYNRDKRKAYQEGYIQAQKDAALKVKLFFEEKVFKTVDANQLHIIRPSSENLIEVVTDDSASRFESVEITSE
jgi:hypothetical protein